MVNVSSTTRVTPITPPATGPVTDASPGPKDYTVPKALVYH